ncbi:hypothetical protein AFB00_14690 [Pseudonocardia sp. HH130630-07]|nr:hypothetical protein AFB00_14690 [Pseudonocardia sp. HH130630-07]
MEIILTAAAQIFRREGMSATTNRIAERAGVSVGSVYQYFPDKRALLDALVARHVAHTATVLRETFAELRATPPDPVAAVLRIADIVVTLHADHPHLHALFARFATRTADGTATVDALRESCVREVAFHLGRRPGAADPEDLARTVVHAVDGLLHHAPAPADRQRQRVREIARLLDG